MSLFEVNNAQESHNSSQSNHNYKDGTSQEPSCILIRPVNNQMIGANAIEKAFQRVDCSVHMHDDKVPNDSHEEKISFINTEPLQYEPCSQTHCNSEGASFFSVEESSTKNLDQHRNHESFPYLCTLYDTERKEGTLISNVSCQFNEHRLITGNSHGSVIIKDKEETETQIVLETLHHEGPSVSQHHLEELPGNCNVQTYDTSGLNHIKDGNLLLQNANSDLLHIDTNSTLTRKNQEADLQTYNQKTKTDHIVSDSLEQDCTLPLWVKWRGKWQTGILCPRIDCPLSTLRAKPTHDRKKYSIVYFPNTKTYSWADTQLVCSINDMPIPLAYGTHINWLSLVEDLTSPRRYIMRKLAISMLNISDQLHTEAVAEIARKASYWTDFATEASCCKNYSDLGKMLLRLQSIILPNYINPNWLQDSFDAWLYQCQNAQSAETVEFLTEQLVDSVLWKDVEELWDAPVQPELGSEWRTWKQEATKLLNTSNPPCSSGDSGQQICDDCVSIGHHMSQKHSKLEIRRSEVFTSETEADKFRYQPKANIMDTDSSYIHCKDLANSSAIGTDTHDASREIADTIDITGHKNIMQTPFEVGASVGTPFESDLGSQNKYRRCSSFIEAKGRQCGRWASDGEIYCCVHLKGPPVFSSSRAEQSSPIEASLCEGITVHGKNCKHRARQGSVFCKKHGHHGGSIDEMDCKRILSSSENKFKRKYEEKDFSGNISSTDGGFKNEIQAGNLVSIVIGETLDEGNCLMDKSNIYDSLPASNVCSVDNPCCIGHDYNNIDGQCKESTKWHMLYCEKHLPNFLKCARDGKSELISIDVFIDLLKSCDSRKDQIYLHRACELLYTYMKSNITHQNSISTGESMGWVLSEVSKDRNVGEFILKLVSNERSKIGRMWGLDTENANLVGSSEEKSVPAVVAIEKELRGEMTIRCKICKEEFSEEQTLGTHWMDIHKKEAQWLFRGYACSICLNSFTNKKVLLGHVTEKHGLKFLEHSVLLRCMMCNSHLPNLEKLWEHILSFHLSDFKLKANQDVEINTDCKPYKDNDNDSADRQDDGQRFICKSCGLKFDLLPDLGRHHQAAHGNLTSMNRLRKSRTNQQLKTSKFHHSRFKKCAGSSISMRKHFQASSSVIAARLRLQTQASETVGLGKLLESHCSNVAETLFAEAHQTKPHPSNSEILAVARSACCQTFIHNALVEKFGTPLRNLYSKAAKFCSELNIPISWHLEGFTCPNGCKPLKNLCSLYPLTLLPDKPLEPCITSTDHVGDGEWEMEECHYILSPKHFIGKSSSSIVLCEDVSFGKEPIPVACVIDGNLKHLLSTSDGTYLVQNSRNPLPWLRFTYVTERLLDPSLCFDTKSSQLGCGCQQKCNAETCDHVYLFNNDYENAKDVYGKSMQGRFPYDESGRIKLEEGYLVYECNSMCCCNRTCENRVLQNGLRIKLEVFWTQRKGWAARAVKPISQGTFVCEYIGEVLNDTKANKSGKRYDTEGCCYLYDINAHIGDREQSSEIQATYVIDATKYGNVSRFINHSCSPNLVKYQVLVESMDCQLAHIGLYASRNIAAGEELVYDYQYKLLPGDGCPCHCGSLECRGRLY